MMKFLRASPTTFGPNRLGYQGGVLVYRDHRNASAPCLSRILQGSMTLPTCLLILWPFSSSTSSSTMQRLNAGLSLSCLLYTSDAADDLLCVDLGGRRIIKKKKK